MSARELARRALTPLHVVGLELAVQHQIEQMLLDRLDPAARRTVEHPHEVMAVEWTVERAHILLTEQELAARL